MVHYDPAASAAPNPPLLCPKCGSHRTQIVGKSPEKASLVVRCNACGARSEIADPSRGEHAIGPVGAATVSATGEPRAVNAGRRHSGPLQA